MRTSAFAPYPEYISAGANWLGSMPASWRVLRGKYSFREYSERSVAGNEALLSVSEYFGVKPRRDNIDSDEHLSRAESLVGYKKCAVNDLVMNIMLAWKKGLGVSKYDGIVSPAYSVFRFMKHACPNYMHYLLRTDLYADYFKARSTGIMDSRLRLYPNVFGDVALLLPSVEEQSQIAEFLDYETAKIDTLIEKQQQLIALLKEKRQAVISHAVAKGLNPDAPVRDSGVEWLGEVPAHWKTCALGKVTVNKCDGPFGSGLKSEHYTEAGIRVVRLQNIKINGYWSGTDAFIDPEHYERNLSDHSVVSGDLLIAGLGDPNNPVGRACVAPAGIEPAMVKADCFRFRIDREKVSPDFVAFQLSTSARFASDKMSSGSTRARIPLSFMAKRQIAYCSLDEQQAIVSQVQASDAKFEKLEEMAAEAIVLLQERRTSLISAAVTGKIDVRGWRAPESEAKAEVA